MISITAYSLATMLHTIASIGTFKDEHFKELSAEIASNQVDVRPTVIDDAWLRDIGPTFVISADRREVRGVNWKFNKYGSGAPQDCWKEDAEVWLHRDCFLVVRDYRFVMKYIVSHSAQLQRKICYIVTCTAGTIREL